MGTFLIETSVVFLPIVRSMDLLKAAGIAIHWEDFENINNWVLIILSLKPYCLLSVL
jgi:hypothetical protein